MKTCEIQCRLWLLLPLTMTTLGRLPFSDPRCLGNHFLPNSTSSLELRIFAAPGRKMSKSHASAVSHGSGCRLSRERKAEPYANPFDHRELGGLSRGQLKAEALDLPD